jgi:hypothetical protein
MLMSTATDAEFARMAALIRDDHPSLRNLVLEPDGRYQTRRMTFDALMGEVTQCLADGFRRHGADELPTLYCAWGKSRVGSTALANLFGHAGMPSYYQPVKAIMRQCLKGEAGVPLDPPPAMVQPRAFSKETAGPYTLAECLIIPFEALIEAGYPAEKLKLIVLDRDPASSLASWINKLSCRAPKETLLRHYVLSVLNTLRVEAYARRAGMSVTHYVYEASKEPEASAHALFARLGLSDLFEADSVISWRDTELTKATNSKVVFPTEPHIYDVPGLHHSDTAYRYQTGALECLDERDMDMLARFGVMQIYQASAMACVRDLGISEATAARLFSIH